MKSKSSIKLVGTKIKFQTSFFIFVVVQLLSCVWLLDPMKCSTPGFPVLHYPPEFAQIYVHWIDDVIQPSYPLSPPSIPDLSLSQHQAFHIRWPKFWTFSFNISPSNEYPRLISFRIDWFDLLAVQETLQKCSPAPQFKSISSSALSLLYGLAQTSINDFWKNHSIVNMDLCWQSDVAAL